MTFWKYCLGFAVLSATFAGCGDDDRPAPVDGGAGDGAMVDGGEPPCSSGTTMCGDRCVDTMNSRAHCGGCDVACDVGEACIEGACGVLCPAGQDECDGACVDVTTDARHCGGCGAPCADGEICVDGTCATSCPAGQEVCGTLCVDTQSNPNHCGACGEACEAGEVCSEGACASTCGAGLVECDGACVDTVNDPANCGDCGTVCTAPTGGAGLCMASMCRSVCDPLAGDCNADLATDGCETSLATDPVNCGACGNVCTLPSAVAGCDAGACVLSACDSGFGDCDSMAANGCETSLVADAANCGACGTMCATGESCYGGTCLTQGTGEGCSSPWYLVDGPNTVMWTATASDYMPTNPACVAVGDVTGPDLVLSYTASTTGTHRLDFDKPTSTRWVAVVSTAACGSLTPELACISDWSPATMGGAFSLTAGETAYVYVRDTDSGTAPLSNPMTVTVTSPTTPSTSACTPGMGGVVGATVTPTATGLSSFTEYYVAADQSPTGYVYVGGLSDLYRIPKAGGAAEDVEALAGLLPTHLGYAMLIDGSNIYTIESNTIGTNGRLWRISTDGGATWAIQDYAHFPMEPNDDFRSATVRGGRIYLVTENDDTSPTTEIWSVDAAATTLPAIAQLEVSVSGEGDCAGIARDSAYFYLTCDDGGDRLVRVPVGGGASELVSDAVDLNLTTSALYGRDLDSDGLFDILYVQGYDEAVQYVCGPATASPSTATLASFGTGTSNYGLGFDRTANVLWMWDDDTQELVSIQ